MLKDILTSKCLTFFHYPGFVWTTLWSPVPTQPENTQTNEKLFNLAFSEP